MPCYDPRNSEANYTEVQPLRDKIDDLTDKLCRTLRHLYKNYPDVKGLPPDVLKWMNEHREWDEKRGEKW